MVRAFRFHCAQGDLFVHALFDLLLPREPASLAILAILIILLVSGGQQILHAWRRLSERSQVFQELSVRPDFLPAVYGMEESALKRRLRLLERSPAEQVEFYARAADAEIEELDAWVGTARFGAGAGVYLGLLGTLLGMAAVVSSLPDPTSGLGATNMARDLGNALIGMKTGFSCTFWGVITSLALSGGIHAYEAKVAAYLDAVDAFMEEKAHAQRAAKEDPVAQLQGTLQGVGTSLKATVEGFAVQLNASGSAFSSVTAQLQSLVENHQKSFDQQVAEREKLTRATEVMSRELADFRQQEQDRRHFTESLANAIQTGISAMNVGKSKVGEERTLVHESIATLAKRFDEFGKSVNEFMEAGLEKQEKQSEKVNRLLEAVRAIVAVVDGSVEDIRQVHSVIQELSEKNAESGRAVSEMGSSLVATGNVMSHSSQALVGHVSALTEQVNALTRQVSAIPEGGRTSSEGGKTSSEGAGELTQAAKDLRAAAQALVEARTNEWRNFPKSPSSPPPALFPSDPPVEASPPRRSFWRRLNPFHRKDR